jgi:hypothetical protein
MVKHHFYLLSYIKFNLDQLSVLNGQTPFLEYRRVLYASKLNFKFGLFI